MTDFPLELQIGPAFESRPEAPDPGKTVQVRWYRVEARRCSCCKEPVVRYFVKNVEGEVLAGGRNWDRMCHYLGWYEMSDAELWPREPPPNKPLLPTPRPAVQAPEPAPAPARAAKQTTLF